MSTVTSLKVDTAEKYLRVNVTRNTKGYSYEKTASVRWDSAGKEDDDMALQEIEELLGEGDVIARTNIKNCERLDSAAERS